MGTHRSTWKRRERDGAGLFGARRQLGSGSGGRADQTRSDSTHERLYIETKLRASSAVRSLWEDTRDRARREGKTPVLVLFAKGKPGGLIVVHQGDLATVAAELARPDTGTADETGPIEPAGPGRDGPGASGSPASGKGATILEPTGPGERPGGAETRLETDGNGSTGRAGPGRTDPTDAHNTPPPNEAKGTSREPETEDPAVLRRHPGGRATHRRGVAGHHRQADPRNVGWISNCPASSLTVRSPFTAARATSALNGGVRIFRLPAIVPPLAEPPD